MGIKEGQTLENYMNVIEYRTYKDEELKLFHEKIQRFYRQGKDYRWLDKTALMKAYGALGKNGGIVLEGIIRTEEGGNIVSYTRPTRMEQFDNLWSQYENWKFKNGLEQNSTIFQKNQQLEKSANSGVHLWVCPKCEKFEGTMEELNKHSVECNPLAEKMKAPEVPDEIPF